MSDARISEPPAVAFKGLVLRADYEQLGKQYGPELQAAVLASLPEECAHLLRSGVLLFGGWYPVSWYAAMWQAAREELGMGVELPREVGRLTALNNFNTVYRTLVSLIPTQTLTGAGLRLWGRVWKGTKVEVLEIRGGYARARWSHCEGFDENVWAANLGAIQGFLEIAGGRHVRLRVIEGAGDGDSVTEADAYWA
jgi:hypothetical protein